MSDDDRRINVSLDPRFIEQTLMELVQRGIADGMGLYDIRQQVAGAVSAAVGESNLVANVGAYLQTYLAAESGNIAAEVAKGVGGSVAQGMRAQSVEVAVETIYRMRFHDYAQDREVVARKEVIRRQVLGLPESAEIEALTKQVADLRAEMARQQGMHDAVLRVYRELFDEVRTTAEGARQMDAAERRLEDRAEAAVKREAKALPVVIDPASVPF